MPGPGLIEQLQKQKITAAAFAPALLGALPEEASEQLPDLETMVMGGEACPPSIAKRWGQSRRLLNGYGPTETTIGATLGKEWNLDEKPPLGKPLPNVHVYVLNKNLQLLPAGIPGELYIGGAGVSRGYLKREELNSRLFINDPFAADRNARMYRTGDRCRWLKNGQLDYIGRRDAQVKIRGYRIELGEIGAVIQQHPDVNQCVINVHQERGVKRLIGYATGIDPKKQLKNATLRAYAKEKLPEYMVPATFMVIDKIPTTLNGKVDFKALPRADMSSLVAETEYVAPTNEIERQLAAIWEQVLGIERVGVSANFFELGGDSILSVQVIARATEEGIPITVKDIFEQQTIRELAKCSSTGRVIKAEQGPVVGQVPLTPIQKWFFEQEPSNPNHFNHWMVLPVQRNALSEDYLEQALTALCDHHDALRARFSNQMGHWQQSFIESGYTPPIQRHDLSKTELDKRQKILEDLTEKAQSDLDLINGPIFKVLAFDFGARDPGRIVLILHHLVSDIISWQSIAPDLQSCLQQSSQGKRATLPPKTTSFKQWASHLSEYASSKTLSSELNYWLHSKRKEVNPLPIDKEKAINNRENSTVKKMSLGRNETRLLIDSPSKDKSISVQSILVAGLALTLSRWSKTSNVLIDLEGHGREESIGSSINLTRTVGWFTSCYPALLQVEDSKDMSKTLHHVAQELADIPNKGIGYGILRYLSNQADIKSKFESLPQAEVAFNYTGIGSRSDKTNHEEKQRKESSGSLGQIALSQSKQRRRTHRFEIVAGISKGILTVRWGYSLDDYQEETVSQLCEEYLQAVVGMTIK